VVAWRWIDCDLDDGGWFGPDARRVGHPASWESWDRGRTVPRFEDRFPREPEEDAMRVDEDDL
jgi:hypothetical protein